MNARIDPGLRRAVRTIYRQANAYADAHGGVDCGMNILYGPPIPEPDVMIVSAQGGGDGRTPAANMAARTGLPEQPLFVRATSGARLQ